MESLFFQSGLPDQDNSIYNIYDHGWAELDYNYGDVDLDIMSN